MPQARRPWTPRNTFVTLNMFDLVVFQEAGGKRPFQLWFDNLDHHAAEKISSALQRLAAGNLSDVKTATKR